jgi:hypothetical protein
MNPAAELAENAEFIDLFPKRSLRSPRLIHTKLYKQKGTAICGAPLHTGLAPPAFTAPCRNQTSVADIQSQSACPLFWGCFGGFSQRAADNPVPGLGMRLQIWMRQCLASAPGVCRHKYSRTDRKYWPYALDDILAAIRSRSPEEM